ncbi:hypothetical protein BC829DRAFT_112491 [Chytridium lagenaria]|nr:hypothetical protein BC829DRAFT_112491 [Chytridium lagenaria]
MSDDDGVECSLPHESLWLTSAEGDEPTGSARKRLKAAGMSTRTTRDDEGWGGVEGRQGVTPRNSVGGRGENHNKNRVEEVDTASESDIQDDPSPQTRRTSKVNPKSSLQPIVIEDTNSSTQSPTLTPLNPIPAPAAQGDNDENAIPHLRYHLALLIPNSTNT